MVMKTVLRSMKRYYTKHILMASISFRSAAVKEKRTVSLKLMKQYTIKQFGKLGYSQSFLNEIFCYFSLIVCPKFFKHSKENARFEAERTMLYKTIYNFTTERF